MPIDPNGERLLRKCGHAGEHGLCAQCVLRELTRCQHGHVDPRVLPWCTQCGAFWRDGIGWTSPYVAHEAHRMVRSDGVAFEHPLVYVETPFRADTDEGRQRNRKYLLACMRDSTARGERPFASHLLYTQFLDDDRPDERALGIACGLAWAAAAILTVAYVDLGISEGMRLGIDDAERVGRLVVTRRLPGWELRS